MNCLARDISFFFFFFPLISRCWTEIKMYLVSAEHCKPTVQTSQTFLAFSFITLSRAGMLPINKYTLASLSHTASFKPLYRFKNTGSKSFKTLLLQKEGKAAICLFLASHSKQQENTLFWPSSSHLLAPKALVRIKCQCVIPMGKIR